MSDRAAFLAIRDEALEAEQLRLLARAVGDHLPVELALRVQALEAERERLASGPSPVLWSSAGELV